MAKLPDYQKILRQENIDKASLAIKELGTSLGYGHDEWVTLVIVVGQMAASANNIEIKEFPNGCNDPNCPTCGPKGIQ